jgi:predicted nuclease of predicted toxin-antitoxin system
LQLDEPPVFFLDRTFGKTKLVEMLRPNGFVVVTHFEEYGDEGHKIGDPVIIQDCGLKNRVLLTGDQDLVHTYAREIRDAKIAVFVTTDNQEGPSKWGPRIVAAKSEVWRELSRRKKPFTAAISKEGRVAHVRLYESGAWRTILIGKRNPPHVNKQKQTGD